MIFEATENINSQEEKHRIENCITANKSFIIQHDLKSYAPEP